MFHPGANLLPPSDCHICFLSEKDVIQSDEKAGSAKSHGGSAQGEPQSSGSRSRAKTGITGRQWSQMAHHQSP
jgi:hypothetical protein